MVQDTGGNNVQNIALAVHNDRMAGVVAALKADDHIHFAAQKVDYLALSLVTPLRTDNGHVAHTFAPCGEHAARQ